MKAMRYILLLLATLSTHFVQAQELEYALELGVMAGPSFYLGDANYHSFYKNTKLAGGILGRYNINPRMAVKFDLAYASIAGDASTQKNKFPDIPEQEWKFSNSVVDFGAQYELSFWGYGIGSGYKGSRRLTPYIQMGLGATAGSGVFTLNIPLGVGVKYKLKERWNIGVDWTMRFTMSDKLDGIAAPYGISGGFLKNKDSYSLTMFYISYDLCPKYRRCNNDI